MRIHNRLFECDEAWSRVGRNDEGDLEMIRQTTRGRSMLLVAAILALLLAMGFNFSDAGISWFWTAVPLVGAGLLMLSVLLAASHVLLRSRSGRAE